MSQPTPSQTAPAPNVGADITRAHHGDGQYLTFTLADEEYAVDILKVVEIRGWTGATHIPRTPSWVKGVINLRGLIVPIIDLRERFQLPKVEYGPTTVVILLTVRQELPQADGKPAHARTIGIVVDAVADVHQIAPDALRPAPDFGGLLSVDFIQGLASIQDRLLTVLDIDRLIHQGVLELLEHSHDSHEPGH